MRGLRRKRSRAAATSPRLCDYLRRGGPVGGAFDSFVVVVSGFTPAVKSFR